MMPSSYIVSTPVLIAMGIAALLQAALSVGELVMAARLSAESRSVVSGVGLVLMLSILIAVVATLTPTSVSAAAIANPPPAMRDAATLTYLAKQKEAEAAARLAEIEAMSTEQRTSLIEAERAEMLMQQEQAKRVQEDAMQKCHAQASAITGKPASPADDLVSKCLQAAYPVGTYDAFALYNEAVSR